MGQIRFAIAGSGWRSLFYWRIACAYPKLFQVTAMYCRSEEKAETMRRKYGVPAVTSEAEVRAANPEFIVVAVNKASICEVSIHWMEMGYPVLCETPAALTLDELNRLWELHTEKGAKLQVAEQYVLYPSFAAGIAAVRRGYLNKPYVIDISAAHDYHAASLIRRYLGIGMEQVAVSGRCYRLPVEETDSRYGAVTDGSVKLRERVRMTFDFESGRSAFYDFDGVQYHSFIRGRHLRVQGQCGELDDDILRYVDEAHQVHEVRMETQWASDGSGISCVCLNGEVLYENPFWQLGERHLLSQDETAIGTMLLGMRDYVATGREVYPLAEALQDAYIRILMSEVLEKAEKSDFETKVLPVVYSRPQPWNNQDL